LSPDWSLRSTIQKENVMKSLFSRALLFSATLAVACLLMASGAATAKAMCSPSENILYIGSVANYFRYTVVVDDATGHVIVTGTLVFDGQQVGVEAEGLVRSSGIKSPSKKRFVATGAANVTGLGVVSVSDASGSTRDEAVTNFVNSIVAGVIIRLL
jgi:hypothetical protein